MHAANHFMTRLLEFNGSKALRLLWTFRTDVINEGADLSICVHCHVES
jgi:hypothetical protein